MKFKILLPFFAILLYSCDQSDGGKKNIVSITRLESDYPFEIQEDYSYGKNYRSTPYYRLGDTLHLQIDLEVISGQLDFVDLYVTNSHVSYNSVDEWINEESERGRVIDFSTYYFADNKLSLNYELIVEENMIFTFDSLNYRPDSTVNIELNYGNQLLFTNDNLYMTLFIKP